ncbi:MAG TPA: FecR domain-containing protein [Telluria sp.]|nr:FecR domain-containing protein [Telluria sp.]
MTPYAAIVLAAALLAAGAPAIAAANPAGTIKNSRGSASIEREGQKLAAPAGAAVLGSDRIVTGADGSVGIMLLDDTLLSVGPNSTVSLDKFAFDPATNDGALSASVKRGTMAVISGKLAKKTPGTVQFSTPSAILGVRGTEFVIDVGDGQK